MNKVINESSLLILDCQIYKNNLNYKYSRIEITNTTSLINFHNISSNQEIIINLSDSSTKTTGLLLYKSTNNDGCLYNNVYHSILFGTNNISDFNVINKNIIE